MPRSLLSRVLAAAAVAALIGAVGGTVAGRADAEDSRSAQRPPAAQHAVAARGPAGAENDPEDCNDAIPAEVIAALEEMAGPDEVLAEGESDAPTGGAPSDSPGGGEHGGDWIADSTTDVINTPVPNAWMPRGRRCRRNRGRRVCDGPRRVPRPHGEAAALAERLQIGSRRTASKILLEPADPAWVAEVDGRESDTLLWPVPAGRLWRGFGYVRRGRARRRLHKGLDIGAPAGSPIRSVNDGLVVYANNEVHGYGNLMLVLHEDSSVAFYAHCQRLYLFPGQRVRRGQVLGEVGHTGLAHGDHLHFELRVGGRPRNPLRRIVGRGDVPTPPPEGDGDS